MDRDNKPVFQQQIESLPKEFIMALDEYNEKHYTYFLNVLLEMYGLSDYISTLPVEDQNSLFSLFESFHNYGFFGGVSFTLNPDVKFEDVAKAHPIEYNDDPDDDLVNHIS